MTSETTAASVVGDLATLVPDFGRHLRSENKSPKTIRSYVESAEQLLAFFGQRGMPTEVVKVRREHIDAFIADLLDRRSASTAARYHALQQGG
jgi:site-specific recombinase XerD